MQHPHSSQPDRYAFHAVVRATNGDDYVNPRPIPIAAHPGSVGASAPHGRAASFNRFDHGCRNAAE